MKISEKIAELKQKEGELMRLYDMRDSVAKQSFKDAVVRTEKESAKEIEKKQEEFLGKKMKRVAELTGQIQKLKEYLVEGKNRVNKKNVDLNIDKKLAEMKFLRLELSKLMNLVKIERYAFDKIDIDLWDKLGILDRIKELEKQKRKLDAEIQVTNWSNEL